ncbi:MAG: LysR family transcriptional regulator [Lachnospiraceae bacterium]
MYANFEHYKIFFYVTKYGNFTRAANALLTSQPSVTCCIQNLENALGCRLFNRSRKGVTLTKEGELLYSYVAPACEEIIKGEEALKQALGTQDTTVRIGVTQMAMRCYLLPRLNQFQESYPLARLKISSNTTPQTLLDLQSGKIDMAIVTTPFHSDSDFRISNVQLFKSVLVGGKKYADLSNQRMHLSKLAGVPLITLAPTSTSFAFYQEFYQSCGLNINPDIEVADMGLIIPMVQQDLGIGFVPEIFAKEAIEKNEVFPITLLEQIPDRNICIVVDKHRPLGIEAQRLQEMLEESHGTGN